MKALRESLFSDWLHFKLYIIGDFSAIRNFTYLNFQVPKCGKKNVINQR